MCQSQNQRSCCLMQGLALACSRRPLWESPGEWVWKAWRNRHFATKHPVRQAIVRCALPEDQRGVIVRCSDDEASPVVLTIGNSVADRKIPQMA